MEKSFIDSREAGLCRYGDWRPVHSSCHVAPQGMDGSLHRYSLGDREIVSLSQMFCLMNKLGAAVVFLVALSCNWPLDPVYPVLLATGAQ